MSRRRAALVTGVSVLVTGWLSLSAFGLYQMATAHPLYRAYVLRDAGGVLRVGWHGCGDETIDRVTVAAGDRPVWDLRRTGPGRLDVPLGTAPPGYAAAAPFRATGEVLSVEVTGTSGTTGWVDLRPADLTAGTYVGGDTDTPAPLAHLATLDPADFGC